MSRTIRKTTLLLTPDERAADARASVTQLTADWLPTEPRLAAPSPEDPTTREQAEALLLDLPRRHRVLCAYLAAIDALTVWIALGTTDTAPQDALTLIRRWLAGDPVTPDDLKSAGNAVVDATDAASDSAVHTVWPVHSALLEAMWARVGETMAVGAEMDVPNWAAFAACDAARALGVPEAARQHLPRWWRRCRAVLAIRDAGTADIEWRLPDA